MNVRNKIGFILIVMVLLFSIDGLAGIDHIHFGSKGSPLQGLTMTWRGNYSNCMIKWGYTTEYKEGSADIEGRTEFGDKKNYLFDYTFPDLKPSQTIHYSFQEYNSDYECHPYKGDWTGDYTFQTSSDAKSDRFTFIAGGDSRGEMCKSSTPGWQAAADALKNTNADFYLYAGDLLIEGGDKLKWFDWYDQGKNFLSQKLIYFSAGNHEAYGDPNMHNFKSQFVLPENGNFTESYYSFEFGNALIINLSAEFDPTTEKGKYDIAQQTAWLTDLIKKHRGPGTKNDKEWIIISFHKPFFTIDKHMGEMTSAKGYYDYSTTWWKDVFDKYGVDVIINGHTHLYMRSVPILLKGTGPGGKDIEFDANGLPSTPVKSVKYGNKPGEGRLEIVTGGYGVKLVTQETLDKLKFTGQWYVDNYKLEFHYCEFAVDGKTLTMTVKRTGDNKILDSVVIKH